MGRDAEPTIFELSEPGPRGLVVPHHRRARVGGRGAGARRATCAHEPLALAEVSERDLVAHFTRLTHRQYSVDLGAYPLGSCTMKYNPKLCDDAAALPGLADVHPAAPAALHPGLARAARGRWRTRCAQITGMAAATLQPPAGAAGELTGLLLMRAWHEAQGQPAHQGDHPRLGPRHQPGVGHPRRLRDGRRCRPTHRGCVDLDALRAVLDDDVAGIMLTNPNTLGPVRGGHRRDRRRRPRGRRPALLRRRQPQRHPRRGPAGRHGLRHRAHEPAQDLRRAPRRRRPGRRTGGGRPTGWPTSCPGPCPVRRRRRHVRLGDAARSRSGGSTPGTATPWPWPGPGPTSWPTAATACAGWPRAPCSTPTGCATGCGASTTCPTTGPTCTSSWPRRPTLKKANGRAGPRRRPSACSRRASTRRRCTSR